MKLKRTARMGGVPLCESWTSMVREVRVVERGKEWRVGVPGKTGGKREVEEGGEGGRKGREGREGGRGGREGREGGKK